MTSEPFEIELQKLQPSQLYISKKKLAIVKRAFEENEIESLGIIPIKKLGDDIILVDGHTRAFVAYQYGVEIIQVVWETEDLDWEMYEICVKWCKDAKIHTIADLERNILPHDDYEVFWHKKCKDMQDKLNEERKKK